MVHQLKLLALCWGDLGWQAVQDGSQMSDQCPVPILLWQIEVLD